LKQVNLIKIEKVKLQFIILCLASFSLVTDLQAQRIKLTNSKNQKEVILSEGMRVVYLLQSKKSGIGTLTEITAAGITVEGTTIPYEDLKRLGRRKKGSGFGSFVMSAFGGALIGSVIFAGNSDPCPQCQTVSVEDEGGTLGNVVAVMGGVTLIALAINSGTKNSARDLAVWKLEVLE
jgi:hypothetical protein